MMTKKYLATRTISVCCHALVECADDAGDNTAILMMPFTYEIWDETDDRLLCYCDNSLWFFRDEDGELSWDFEECVTEWMNEACEELTPQEMERIEFVAGGFLKLFDLTVEARGEMLDAVVKPLEQKLIKCENERKKNH